MTSIKYWASWPAGIGGNISEETSYLDLSQHKGRMKK